MSEQQKSELNGVEQAAVLLLSVGKKYASSVLKHMGPREVQKVGHAMSTLTGVTSDQMEGVMGRFLQAVGKHTAIGVDSEEYIREMLVDALGQDKAGGLMDRILMGGSSSGLDTLKWMGPRAIADMIRNEHPQIMAIVLAYLDADQSAEVLGVLPERMRPDLIMRIATLDTIQPAAMFELNQILESQVTGNAAVQSSGVGGTKCAAEILNFVDSNLESVLMEQVKETDSELGEEIEDLMFVFENLIDVDDSSVQGLLREVSTDVLLIALKGTDDSLKEKFFKNMSKRAAEMLRDDLEAKGPVKLSEVEAAQKEILGIARRMAEEGTIALGGAGGEEMV